MRVQVIALLTVALPIFTSKAMPSAQQFRLRATVIRVQTISSPIFTQLPREYIRTDFDAQFSVTVRVISISPRDARFLPGRTVTFVIHSPSILFSAPNPRGQTYDFDVRTPRRKDGFWSLQTRRKPPDQAVQPEVGRTFGPVPDAVAAIRIAVTVWEPIYGKEHIASERPFHATLNHGVWHVRGSLRRGAVGGVAEADIRRSDGKVLRITHGK